MLELVAILGTLLLTGVELSIGLFVHPVLSRLSDAAHAEAAKPLARLLGRVMPFWYAAALLSVAACLFFSPLDTWSWWACLAASVLLAATIPFSLICLVPINNRVLAWDLAALPTDWKQDRRRWDAFHVIRVAMLLAASVCLLAGLRTLPASA